MDVITKLSWCKKKGLKLIEPNDNLFIEYINTAEETLDILRSIRGKSKVWLATTKYYCEYFALYSLLMKIGIKSEIHDCTITVSKLLEEKDIIPKGYTKMLENDKQLRIDNQYYLKNRDVPINYDEIVDFVLKIKNIANRITLDKMSSIRKIIENS